MPRETQYENLFNFVEESLGYQRMGPMASWAWHDDPRHVLFTLSRYKFVAKMFHQFKNVLEVGCGDGFYSRIVAQTVERLVAIDFDDDLINKANTFNQSTKWPIHFHTVNPIHETLEGSYDGIYHVDVLEHISPQNEKKFIEQQLAVLTPGGCMLVGTPSLESQQYASPQSKQGHINCKTQAQLKQLMQQWFHHVFIFSMNDEVMHTGYASMSHYNFALCCSRK